MTDMTDMTDIIVKTLYIKANPETVWTYLTDKDKLGRWFHSAREDLRAGESYALMSDETPDKVLLGGRVLEFDPPRKLAYTFTHEWMQNVETVVTWTLTPAFGGTRLHLTHSGFAGCDDPFKLLQDHDAGWDEHLAKLRHVRAD